MSKERYNIGTAQCMWMVFSSVFERHRFFSTVLIIFLIALVSVYIMVLGYYGICIKSSAAMMVEQAVPEKIVAEVPDYMLNEKSMMFNKEKKALIKDKLNAKIVFEDVRLGVYLSIPGERKVYSIPSSTVPGDPILEAPELRWGKGMMSDDSTEIVVSEHLLEKLTGGPIDYDNIPPRISLSIERNSGTASHQKFERAYKLVGIKRNAEGDMKEESYVPLMQMMWIDMWCSNAPIDNVPESGGRIPVPELSYNSARVFVKDSLGEKAVTENASRYGIKLEKVSTFKEEYTDGPPWIIISAKGESISNHDGDNIINSMKRIGIKDNTVIFARNVNAKVLTGSTIVDAKIKAISIPESRLAGFSEELAPIGENGSMLISRGFAAKINDSMLKGATSSIILGDSKVKHRMDIAGVLDENIGFGSCDIFCSSDTLMEMLTRFSTEPCCVVWTPDPAALSGIEKVCKGIKYLPAWKSVRFYNTSGHIMSDQRTFLKTILGIGKQKVVTRFMDDQTFWFLAGRNAGSEDSIPAIFTVNMENNEPHFAYDDLFSGWIKKHDVCILNILVGSNDEIWFPESIIQRFGLKVPEERGITFVPGDSRYSNVIFNEPESRFETHSFITILEGGREEVESILRKEIDPYPLVMEIMEFEAVPEADVRVGSKKLKKGILLCEDPNIGGLPFDWAKKAGSLNEFDVIVNHEVFPSALHMRFAEIMGTRMPIVRAFGPFPSENYVFARKARIEQMSGSVSMSNPGKGLTKKVMEVSIPSLRHFDVIKAPMVRFNVTPPITKSRSITCYNVKNNDPNKTFFDKRLLPVLQNDIMFRSVTPNILTEARIDGLEKSAVSLIGSTHADMTRNMCTITRGEWLSGGARQQVVLPEDFLKASGLLGKGGVSPGTLLTLCFEKKVKRSVEEPVLKMRFEVKGIVSGSTGFIPTDIAKKISLWQAGEISYNTHTGEFAQPESLYESRGHLRCNIIMNSADEVQHAVTALKSMGYETEDFLGSREEIRKLGVSILTLVTLFVSGIVISGTMTVLFTTWMNTKTYSYEIGILLAHGMEKKKVVYMYLIRGFFLGICAATLGFLFSVMMVPSISSLLSRVHITINEVTEVPIYDTKFLWLHCVSLLVCVLSSEIGVLFSAIGACTQPIRSLLSRRE